MESLKSAVPKGLQYKDTFLTWQKSQSRLLTFKNRASYIQDGGTATLQMLHFIYFYNNYKYWVF